MLQPRVLDLNAVLAGMERMLRRLIREDIDLVTSPAAEPVHVYADPGQLEQVVVNLVVNARDAMPRGGTLTLAVGRTHGAGTAHLDPPPGAGCHATLAVSDTGVGMCPDTLEHAFEPFFTTKPRGEGTGLGLSTVYGIVRQSGGSIGVESEVGVGTTFLVALPCAEGAAAPEAPPGPAGVARGSETVLLVEDEDSVRALVARILARSGYTVLEARSGEEAAEIAHRHPGPVDLLVTDVVMPRMSGTTLAQHLCARRPGLRVLFMSGYSEDAVAQHGVLEPGTAFIGKPFTPAELSRRVRGVLDAPGGAPRSP
ncbi:MAG TPA: response regulator [Longimicrobiaceae bacterium]